MKSEFNYELKPWIKVRFIQNKQFKSVQMMVSFIHELESERELASRTLLAGILESSSAAYPNQHAITLKLAELYGATFGANTEVEGNLSLLNFVYSFVAPGYLAAGQSLLDESAAFESMKWTAENGHPIIPLLFVTIACGIISGFHATQSPIIARTLKSERQAKSSFYGMMVLEGLIAMIWAAAGLAVYNLFPDYFNVNPNDVLLLITKHFLGSWMGLITVVAVIILAITSGDTAMRSMRLSLAEMFSIDQKSVSKRILTCVPLILAVVGLLAWSQASEKSFGQLWNYFAWGNQVLAASTLMAATVWLFKQKKNGYVSLIPGIFMTFIVISYIVWISPEHGGPVGFGADLEASYIVAGIATLVLGGWVYKRAIKKKR